MNKVLCSTRKVGFLYLFVVGTEICEPFLRVTKEIGDVFVQRLQPKHGLGMPLYFRSSEYLTFVQ